MNKLILRIHNNLKLSDLLPLNLVQVCDNLGYDLRRMEGQICGKIETIKGRPTIYYNSSEKMTRMRFSVAHSIGHLVLGHENPADDYASDYTIVGKNSVQAQANEFATKLLINEEMMMYLIDYEGIKDLNKMSDEFQVADACMSYRLKLAGIL